MSIDPIQRALDSLTDAGLLDWAALESAAADDDARQTLHALRDIAAIARAHEGSASNVASVPFAWGPLQVRAHMARGAHGDVYRAWDPRLERDVALKLLRGDSGRESEAAFAINEGRLLARVRHPNVVSVFGADRIGGQAGLWMELVGGATLRELVARNGPLHAGDVIRIGLEICDGLAAIHAAGLVHRDIKAQNVVREPGGRTILMDLSAGQEDSDPQVRLEGTPLYLAPEILEGGRATTSSDIYALGVLLYFLLSARYPVSASSMEELRGAHRAGDVRRLAASSTVPPRLAVLVDRAIDPQPSRRYASAAEFRAALEAVSSAAAAPGQAWWRKYAAVIVFSTVVAGGTWGAWRASEPQTRVPFSTRQWVLIADVENRTGEPVFDHALDVALARELSTSAHVNVAPPERIDDALKLMRQQPGRPLDLSTAREVAQRDGQIQLVIAGGIVRLEDQYAVTLRLVDPGDGSTVASRTEPAKTEQGVPRAVQHLARWVQATLGDAAAGHADDRQLARATTTSLEALRLYSDALAAARAAEWPMVEAAASAALALDPDFASARIWLAWALANQQRRDQGKAEAERALQSADAASARERYFIRASYFLLQAQRDRALGELQALVARYPDDHWGLHKLAQVYTSMGRNEEFLALAQRIADIRPLDIEAQADLILATNLSHGAAAAAAPAARARQLISAAPPETPESLAVGYVRLFPVHESWAEWRIDDAVRLLDAADAAAPAESDWQRHRRATMRLALGQLRQAKEVFRTIRDADLRATGLSLVDLGQSGGAAIPRLLRSYRGSDLLAVSLHIRAGELNAAARLLGGMPIVDRIHYDWTVAELEAARWNTETARSTLQEATGIMRRLTGGRAFTYSESLAEALVRAGEVDQAIAVLRDLQDTRDRLFNQGGHTGHLWIRTQKQLADLLRQSGRPGEAAAIERELLTLLSAADSDHPLLLELRRRTR